jgi:uncharacterized protein YcbX
VTTDARVTRLLTAPIKGLRVNEPRAIELTRHGVVGDRAFMLVDADARVTTVASVGALLRLRAEYEPRTERLTVTADGGRACEGKVRLGEPVQVDHLGLRTTAAREAPGPWDELITEVAGLPLRLVRPDAPGGGSDLAPVTLVGDGSLTELERQCGSAPVDARRFRMLIQFGPAEPHVEDTWDGRLLHVGEALLRVGATVPRCTAITRHPDRGDRDAPLVTAIKTYRGLQETGYGRGVPFGVYAQVVEEGPVHLGDAVRLGPR